MNRPTLRQRIMWWVWEGRPEWLTDWLFDRNVGRLLCIFWGHEPIRDHCGLPEHDYCVHCSKPMPGQATR